MKKHLYICSVVASSPLETAKIDSTVQGRLLEANQTHTVL